MLIRRRPSAATLVAVFVTLALGSQAGLAAQSTKKDRNAPQAVRSVEVTATDGSSVTITWEPSSRPNEGVAGYGIYVDGAQVGTETPERVKKWRDRDSLSYTIRELACGRGYTVGVDAFDRDDNHSPMTSTTVSTSACPDATPPSSPTGVRQVATTESSVMLAWSPSADNVGVVEYGLYVAGLRVATVSDASATLTNLACGRAHLVGIDAADAAGNRSPRVDSYFRTSACPSTNQPPSTPTGLKVATATSTSVTLAWTASTDDGAVAGYGLYLSGNRTAETTTTSAAFPGLQCGTTYTLGVDAFDNAGKRSTVAELSAATSPCATPPPPPPPSAAGTVTQTIAEGTTLSGAVNWRAAYDRNGDNVQDDPGSLRFLVDGQVVLTEQSLPFGDTAGFWASSSVTNGRHTFEVRAVSDTGTVVATNTVTASVANDTSSPPPPPPSLAADTTPPASPSSLRVVSATATSVTIAWNPATDNVAVAGYGLYRGTSQTGQTQQTTANYGGLTCGTAYQVGVDAYDAAGNRSSRADLAVTTAPCADSQSPTAPTNVTASTRTTTSIALTWAPATDNVGVAGYGIYNDGELVNTTTGTTGIVSSLVCGTNYTLAVDAFDPSGNSSPKTTVMVATLPCADTSAPTVATTAPTNGATVSGTINEAVNATDNVGVTKVEFLRDGVMYGQDTTSPYATTFNTTTVPNGPHTFGARAYDAAGNVGTAANVTVTVSNVAADTSAPTVATTAPTNGATVSGTINEAVNATDNVGVTKVEFLRDGVMYGQDTTSPYATTFNTTTVPNGPHTFGARAYDAAGNVGTAANVTVTVSNVAPPAPTGCAVTTPHVPDGPDGMGGCWPGPANTGVPPGTTLTAYTGSCTLASGTYDARTFNCDVVITGTVTITRSNVRGSIDLTSGGNLTISDSNVDASPNEPRQRRGIYANGGNTSILRTEIIGGNSNVWCSPCTMRDSYAHGQEIIDPWHASSVRADQNSTVIHNTLWCEAQPIGQEGGCSADLTGYPDFQPTHHWTIERNLFMQNTTGNAFCAYGGNTSGKPYSNDSQNATYIVFRDNVFQRGANGKCAAFSPIIDFASGRTGNVWTNNKLDNGVAVNPG